MYPGLFQQQQQNGTGQSGSTTPTVTSNGTRRPGSPGSNGTVTPGPPELQNGVPAVSAANGMQQHGIQLFPAAYIDPSSGQTFLRGAAPNAAAAAAAGLRLIQPQGPQGHMMMNNVLAAQPQTSLGFASNGSSSGASRRESMDRGSSSAFSPSLLEQYKNKGWTTSYALGTGMNFSWVYFKAFQRGFLNISGSGSLTPPPAAAAGLGTAGAAGLGLFGGQRFSSAPTGPGGASADRNAAFGLAMAYASAAAARNAAAAAAVGAAGSLGFSSNNNLFNNTKTRHNSIDRASNNRSLLLEDFR